MPPLQLRFWNSQPYDRRGFVGARKGNTPNSGSKILEDKATLPMAGRVGKGVGIACSRSYPGAASVAIREKRGLSPEARFDPRVQWGLKACVQNCNFWHTKSHRRGQATSTHVRRILLWGALPCWWENLKVVPGGDGVSKPAFGPSPYSMRVALSYRVGSGAKIVKEPWGVTPVTKGLVRAHPNTATQSTKSSRAECIT